MKLSYIRTENFHQRRLRKKNIPIVFDEQTGEIKLSIRGYKALQDFLIAGIKKIHSYVK